MSPPASSAAASLRVGGDGRTETLTLRSWASVIAAVAIVAALYGIWLGSKRPFDHPERLAQVSEGFLAHGKGTSAAIDGLESVAVRGYLGYDGQFFVAMAIDPVHAPAYMEDSAGEKRYRMGRIGLPIAARAISGGSRDLIPWVLLGLELLAVLAATFVLAYLGATRGGSAFAALLYGLSPGLFFSASHLLSETLANALALLGVLLWLPGRRGGAGAQRLVAAGLAFAAAALTRETTILFPLAIALWMASTAGGRSWPQLRPAVTLLGIAVAPLLAWHGFLAWWLGGGGAPTAAHFEWIPFGGLLVDGITFAMTGQVLSVVLPCAIAVWVTARWTRWSVWTALVTLNAVVLIVFLPRFSYSELGALSRITLPVIIGFVLALPEIHGRVRVYAALSAGWLWMLPWLDWYSRFLT